MAKFKKLTPEILHKRLLLFAQRGQKLITKLPRTSYNLIYSNQLIRSSSSPGANYIEAVEATSAKEFIHRLKICRKEVKESNYWLILIQNSNLKEGWVKKESDELIREGTELIKIFTASIITSERNLKIKKLAK